MHICDDYGILFGLHFIGRFAILPIIGSLGLFLFFSKMNITSTIINLLAQSAFVVYLISENPNVYPWFWKRVFDNIDYFNTPYMIGVALLAMYHCIRYLYYHRCVVQEITEID